jgi:Spx/MgsR family transcriptional regulator
MSTPKIYGIKNCDTIKKAKKWLTEQNIEFIFYDYRIDGLDKHWLVEVVSQLGWENVLNKRGTTYRQLSDDIKNSLDQQVAIDQMLEAPAMIKRPILELNGQYQLGFKPAQYLDYFNKA